MILKALSQQVTAYEYATFEVLNVFICPWWDKVILTETILFIFSTIIHIPYKDSEWTI